MIDLSVIIVSYNTRNLLKKCLASVEDELTRSKITGEIIVVDNGSRDDSLDAIKKFRIQNSRLQTPGASATGGQAEFRIDLIENKENIGFGEANNLGAERARGRYILFLNSDTVVKPGGLAKMVDFMDKNPKIGIASCRLLNSDGTDQPQGGFLPRLSTVAVWALFLDDLPILGEILPSYQMGKACRSILPGVSWRRQETPDNAPGNALQIGWVGGTAMFARGEAWKQLGGFDEKIFMYGEDVEICYRANKQGWKVAVNPEAEIVHAGKSSGGSWVVGEVKGLLYIFKKHKMGWEMPILRVMLAAGMGLRWLIFGILAGNETLRRGYAEAFGVVRQ